MYIFDNLTPVHKLTLAEVGGKAYNLARINDFNVPKWFVVSSNFFINWLGNNLVQIEYYLENYSDENYQRIRDIIINTPFPSSLIMYLDKKLSKKTKYAVRSSAIDEDSDNHSFAGIMESYLNVGIAQVEMRIKDCFLSAFSSRAIEYRRMNQLNLHFKMAVIIQEMVDAEFAGVINTINPITNNPDEIVISVVKGLGDKLVNGDVEASEYYVSKENTLIVNEDIISKELLDKLLVMIKKLVKRFAHFQDIEFATRNNKIYFLQTRTITPYSNINLNLPRVILDNANIIESYSGVTTPLTFSFAKEVYYKVYTQTLKAGDINNKIINSLDSSLKEMLYFYENKIYYKLNSWYYLNSIFPGSKNAISYMENMMGLSVKTSSTKKVKMNLYQTLKLGIIFLKRLKKMPKDSEKFIKKFDQIVMPYVGGNFSDLNKKALLELYETIEREILNDFTTPIINDCGAMVYYGVFTKFLKKLKIENFNGYLSYLVGRQGDVESTESIALFQNIINAILEDEEIVSDFITMTPYLLKEKYHSNTYISTYITAYINKFGPRVMDELKLETITLVEDPLFLYEMLQNYLKNMSYSPQIDNFDNNNFTDIRIPFGKIWLYKHLLSRTKYFIKNRERLRLKRTYVYSVVRNIFIQIGKIMTEEGLILNYRDIFFLTKDEVFDWIRENKFDMINQKITNRKKEYDDNAKREVYNRINIYGNVILPVSSERSLGNQNFLKGIPSGAGYIKGKVILVENPSDSFKDGDIILAKRTDPGWIPLFSLCKGLIVERGSILSHSAVVAREMGIPAVVGIPNATKIIKNNTMVELDGVKGEVKICE